MIFFFVKWFPSFRFISYEFALIFPDIETTRFSPWVNGEFVSATKQPRKDGEKQKNKKKKEINRAGC